LKLHALLDIQNFLLKPSTKTLTWSGCPGSLTVSEISLSQPQLSPEFKRARTSRWMRGFCSGSGLGRVRISESKADKLYFSTSYVLQQINTFICSRDGFWFPLSENCVRMLHAKTYIEYAMMRLEVAIKRSFPEDIPHISVLEFLIYSRPLRG
jgi:hypothetical protein